MELLSPGTEDEDLAEQVEQKRQQRQQAQRRVDQLAERLRSLGVDPDAIDEP